MQRPFVVADVFSFSVFANCWHRQGTCKGSQFDLFQTVASHRFASAHLSFEENTVTVSGSLLYDDFGKRKWVSHVKQSMWYVVDSSNFDSSVMLSNKRLLFST